VGTALVIAAGHGLAGGQAGPLGHPALVWLGDRSYSWYLWYWPVIDAAGAKHPRLRLAQVLVLAIPVLNLAGWLLGRLLPRSTLMPLGYRVIGVRAFNAS
jgi:peptidoglycan/LPS O-acetylase OafA/YrhL